MNKLITIIFSTIIFNFMFISCDDIVDKNDENNETKKKAISFSQTNLTSDDVIAALNTEGVSADEEWIAVLENTVKTLDESAFYDDYEPRWKTWLKRLFYVSNIRSHFIFGCSNYDLACGLWITPGRIYNGWTAQSIAETIENYGGNFFCYSIICNRYYSTGRWICFIMVFFQYDKIYLHIFCRLSVTKCCDEPIIEKQERKIHNDAIITYCGNMLLEYCVEYDNVTN